MKTTLEKFSKKFQGPVIIAAAVCAGLVLIFTLSFLTDVSALYNHTDPDDAVGYVEGSWIYFDAQGFNKVMLILSLVMILAAAALFVFFSQNRRIYYLSNYIVTGIYAAYSFFIAALIFVFVVPLRSRYVNGVDWEGYKQITEGFNGAMEYVKSTFWFDAGIVLGVALVLLSGLLIANSVVKHKVNKQWKTPEKTAGTEAEA